MRASRTLALALFAVGTVAASPSFADTDMGPKRDLAGLSLGASRTQAFGAMKAQGCGWFMPKGHFDLPGGPQTKKEQIIPDYASAIYDCNPASGGFIEMYETPEAVDPRVMVIRHDYTGAPTTEEEIRRLEAVYGVTITPRHQGGLIGEWRDGPIKGTLIRFDPNANYYSLTIQDVDLIKASAAAANESLRRRRESGGVK